MTASLWDVAEGTMGVCLADLVYQAEKCGQCDTEQCFEHFCFLPLELPVFIDSFQYSIYEIFCQVLYPLLQSTIY